MPQPDTLHHEEAATEEGAHCSATGGSARSQAADLDERSWRPRPLLGGFVRVLAVAGPFLVTYVMIRLAMRVVPRPVDNLGLLLIWFVGLGVLATAVLQVAALTSRRIIPVSMLMRASLLFPDNAPSRFRLALRAATGRQLAEAVERGRSDDLFHTPQEAAEALLVQLAALSRHDRMTRGHSERVRAYTDLIAEEMELDSEDAAKLRWAALIHDIGKLEVPEQILNKNGRPTDEEWEVIRRHPAAAGPRLDALAPWLGEWAMAAFDHHERYDGRGYPLGLAGEEISRAGRIVAVADAYDVMTAPRSYKPSLPAEQARAELAANSGTQFDPEVVRAFLAVSLGRRRVLAGPLAWLAQLPTVLSGPVASMGTAGVGIVPTVAVGTTLALAGAANVGAMLDEVTNLVPGGGGPDAPTEVAVGEIAGPLYEPTEQLLGAVEYLDGSAPDGAADRRGSTEPSGSRGVPGDESGDPASDPPDELAAASVEVEEGDDPWSAGARTDDPPPSTEPTASEYLQPVAPSTVPTGGADSTVPPPPPVPPTTGVQAHSSGGGAAPPPPAPMVDAVVAFDEVQSEIVVPVATTPPDSTWASEWEQMTADWDGWENFDELVVWMSWGGWQEWDGWQAWDGWDDWTGGWSDWFDRDGRGGGRGR